MLAFLRQAFALYGRRGVDWTSPCWPVVWRCLASAGDDHLGVVRGGGGQLGNPLYHMIRHLIYVVLGLGAGAAMLLVPLSFWQRMDWMLLTAAFGLLIWCCCRASVARSMVPCAGSASARSTCSRRSWPRYSW